MEIMSERILHNRSNSKNWSAELKGDYQSDLVYSQLILKSFAILGFTVQKKFAKGNATARVGVNDIFIREEHQAQLTI